MKLEIHRSPRQPRGAGACLAGAAVVDEATWLFEVRRRRGLRDRWTVRLDLPPALLQAAQAGELAVLAPRRSWVEAFVADIP